MMYHHIDRQADKTEPRRRQSPPLKAIRAKCIDCSGGSLAEVRHCHLTKCPLHPYRMGENPFAKSRGRPSKNSNGFSPPPPAGYHPTDPSGSLKNSPQIAANSDGK
jgi:hypothetical protein